MPEGLEGVKGEGGGEEGGEGEGGGEGGTELTLISPLPLLVLFLAAVNAKFKGILPAWAGTETEVSASDTIFHCWVRGEKEGVGKEGRELG